MKLNNKVESKFVMPMTVFRILIFLEVMGAIIATPVMASYNGAHINKVSLPFPEKKVSAYKASMSLFLATGRFESTTEEDEANLEGYGLFAEIRPTTSLWALRSDFFTTKKESNSGSLGVRSTYREFRLWALRYFPIDSNLAFYGGGGFGALSTLTELSVMSDSKAIEGRAEFVASYFLGLRISFKPGVFLELFRQSSYAPSYPNQNLSSYAFSMGYTF